MTRKDLKVQVCPISGWMATITAMRAPPAAARADATPKVTRWMRCTSIPQTIATSRLCEVARMALPSLVHPRKRKDSPVSVPAKTNATTRVFERANGPTTHAPVRYSTERRSEVKRSWARFTSAIETPKVSSSEESSGASTTRKTSVRSRTTPTTKRTAMRSEEHTSELQSQSNLVCRLLLEKKKKKRIPKTY